MSHAESGAGHPSSDSWRWPTVGGRITGAEPALSLVFLDTFRISRPSAATGSGTALRWPPNTGDLLRLPSHRSPAAEAMPIAS